MKLTKLQLGLGIWGIAFAFFCVGFVTGVNAVQETYRQQIKEIERLWQTSSTSSRR